MDFPFNLANAQRLVPSATTGSGTGSDILMGAEKILSDKNDILGHPLFPLMSMLFEKCESATSNIGKVTSTELFNAQMTEFASSMSSNRALTPAAPPLIGANKELDNLMIKAIQVLRIHLLELEKVNELCLDFCSRYIASIKTKLNSHTLLRGDDSDSDDEYEFGPYCPPMESESTSTSAAVTGLSSPTFSSDQNFQPIPPFGTSRQLDEGSLSEMLAHGRTPMSSIGLSKPKQSSSSAEPVERFPGLEMSRTTSSLTSKRGVLPKHATQTMKSWLFQHIVHPYPTEEEKKRLSLQTNLSILQVNNWFINARRRILQPMLESSSASPEQSKSRKCKAQARQAQRFWPFTPADENTKDCQANPLVSVPGMEYSASKDNTEESPMLSQANTREISPTLLQTNYSSVSNSDSGDCLPDTTGNISEPNSHSSDILCPPGASASNDMTALNSPLDPVG